ncbi:PilW family protein [Marinobacterium sp. BA1]|uniref:PilW family protein n=1 Tax=Marinobacterium sp. BA1 TaxID=3138931 RepID=UPI0032E7001C
MQHKPLKQPKAQAGMSLVELMIALVIGLLILMGVLTVYLSGARTAATTEALSRVQESGRFGIFFLSRDIRQAGFKSACQGEVNNLLDEGSAAYDDTLFDLNDPIVGWDDSAGTLAAALPEYVRGDVLMLKSASTVSGVTASGNTPANAAAISLDGPSGIEAGTIMFVGDSQGCDLFQKGNNANAQSIQRPASGTPGNKNPNTEWSHAYDDSMQIFLFQSTAYYIGNGIDGQPALRRASFNTGAAVDEELVNGIEDMQLLYGEDTDGNQTADRYVAAGAVADWDDVVAVQVNLLASSLSTNVIDEAQALPVPWDALADPGDGRLRRVFTTNVGIRNRLP